MKQSALVVPLVLLLLTGCSTWSTKSRMEDFGHISQAYKQALLMSNYNVAAKFVDPSVSNSRPDIKKFKNIKIVDYTITRVDVNKDSMEVKQDVELQYFLLNGNVLHTVSHPQIWRYHEEAKTWLLQSGLPDFGL